MSDKCKQLADEAIKDCHDQLGGVVIRLRDELRAAQAAPPCCNSWPIQFAEIRLHIVESVVESLSNYEKRGGLPRPDELKSTILDKLRSMADELESSPAVDVKVEETAPN